MKFLCLSHTHMHANLANLIFFSFFFVGASAVARFSLKLNALLFVFGFFIPN